MDPRLFQNNDGRPNVGLVKLADENNKEIEVDKSKPIGEIWFKPLTDNRGNLIVQDNKFLVKQVYMKEDIPKESPENFGLAPWIMPVSAIIVLIATVSTFVLPFFIGFILLIIPFAILFFLMMMAGQNFWLWVAYRYGKTRNWGLKFRHYISGRKELLFGELKENETFAFTDYAGKKRMSQVRTKNPKFITNLGTPFVYYREGLLDSADLDLDFPTSYEDRENAMDLLAAYRSGELSNADELSQLNKKKEESMTLYIILAGIGLILLFVAYQNYTMPAEIAKAMQPILENILGSS